MADVIEVLAMKFTFLSLQTWILTYTHKIEKAGRMI